MFNFLKSSGPKVQPIAPADAVARAAKGALVVIDVRDMGELRASGKAKGALHVPLSVFQHRMNPQSGELPAGITPETPICLYCASGGRSGMAGDVLLRLGYTNVFNLGGLGHWQAGGGAIEKA